MCELNSGTAKLLYIWNFCNYDLMLQPSVLQFMIMDGMLSIRLLCSTEHELTQSADLKLEIQNPVVPGMIMTGRIKIHLSHQDSSFSVFPFLLTSQAVSSLFSLKSHRNNLIENT